MREVIIIIHTHTNMKMKVMVTQSSPTLCAFMDCSPPGFSVHGILQARTLEWIAMTSSYIYIYIYTHVFSIFIYVHVCIHRERLIPILYEEL